MYIIVMLNRIYKTVKLSAINLKGFKVLYECLNTVLYKCLSISNSLANI